MPIAAAVSNQPSLAAAVAEAASEIQRQLLGRPPQLSFAFVSHHYRREFPKVAQQILHALGSGTLLGCTAETVIAGSREYEGRPTLALWSADLPGMGVTPFHLTFERTPDGMVCAGLPEGLAIPGVQPFLLLLGEPFSCDAQVAINLLEQELDDVAIAGGMASGGRLPGENRLFLNNTMIEFGAIGVAITGASVRTIVSQGCKPVGAPFVVTDGEENIVTGLGGLPPLRRLESLYGELSARDQQLLEQGLHLGIAMTEYRDHFERGDFLVSNVLGADRESGAIAIGNHIRRGQTVQFHLRDAETADEDLRLMLQRHLPEHRSHIAGGLLFSCNGRGTRLFSTPDHDAAAVLARLGNVPLAGFFAQGELGPVGGKNYIHGYSASLVLFEEAPSP